MSHHWSRPTNFSFQGLKFCTGEKTNLGENVYGKLADVSNGKDKHDFKSIKIHLIKYTVSFTFAYNHDEHISNIKKQPFEFTIPQP